MAIQSLLKLGIKNLPEGQTVKGKAVPNVLKKSGVKEEELKYAGLDLEPEKSYTKSELETVEKGRKDEFGEQTFTGQDVQYQFTSLTPGRSNPTYKENVYTFTDGTGGVDTAGMTADEAAFATKGDPSRYTSGHFADTPNYLFHTRTYDDTLEGKPTRIVQEIQSDLHQEKRAASADKGQLDTAIQLIKNGNPDTEGFDEAFDLLNRHGMTPDNIDQFMAGNIPVIPESPYEKSWLAKGIERELNKAAQDGRSQLAIPITGTEMSRLNRAEGVQKWYETSVANTAKKIAKQNGMDFKMVNSASTDKEALTGEWAQHLDEIGVEKYVEPDQFISLKEADMDVAMDFARKLKASDQQVSYAVISPKAIADDAVDKALDPSKLNLKLYANPAAAVGAAYLAIKEGSDPKAQLTEAGYDEAEINSILADADIVKQGVADGIPFQDFMDHLKSQEHDVQETSVEEDDPSLIQRGIDALTNIKFVSGDEYKAHQSKLDILSDGGMSAEELLSHLKVVQPNMSAVSTRLYGYAGNSDAYAQARALETASAQRIVDMFHARGFKDITWSPAIDPGFVDQLSGGGKFYIGDPANNQVLDEGFWNAMSAEESEMLGGITGAFAGGAAGLKYAPNHPLAKAGGVFLGSLAGAAGGAVLGTELDYLKSSVKTQEDMSAAIAGRKALTAAEASVIGDFFGYNIGKFGSAAWSGISRVKNLLVDGNTAGARKAAQEFFFLADSEVDDLIKRFRDVTDDPDLVTKTRTVQDFQGQEHVAETTVSSQLNRDQEALRAMVMTQPGGEAILKAAGTIDPKAGQAVARSLDKKAQDVIAETTAMTNENAGRILKQDLANYVSDTKAYYGKIKNEVALSPRINQWEFDYNKLAINPMLSELQKNITDPRLKKQFVNQAMYIKRMSDSRTLSDLIELRQFLNDFRFNKRIAKVKDHKLMDSMVQNIDGAIKQGAQTVVENPDVWLKNWQTAKTQYAKMKGTEKNTIFRALNANGVKEETVVKALTKYVNSIDGSFQDAMTALPPKSRQLAEGAVLDNLTHKFTQGSEGGLKVIDFPGLAKELSTINFTDPKARQLNASIEQLAEVFRNDLQLARNTGHIQIPMEPQGLTDNLLMKAKYEFAAKSYGRIKQVLPGKKGAEAAVVRRTAELLETPLNAKKAKELMDSVDGDVNIAKEVQKLQQQYARVAAEGKDTTSLRANLYGDGKVLSTKGSGEAKQIPIHRIAKYEDMKTVADTYGVDINDTKTLYDYLTAEGYVAVQQGTDKVRVIK